jgi:hypothetical protein
MRNAALEMDFQPGGRLFRDQGERTGRALATITFADENGGTRLRYIEQMRVIPPSDGAEGRHDGWSAWLDGLADNLVEDRKNSPALNRIDVLKTTSVNLDFAAASPS